MKPFYAVIVSFIFLFSVSSCKKNSATTIQAVMPFLSVKLASQYLDVTKVDSAYAFWEVNNTVQKIKMSIHNDSLVADMKLFIEGNGIITICIFSSKRFDASGSSQWILTKPLHITRTSATNYSGPISFFDNNWKPRAALNDGAGHKAMIGLRPDDSYFLIENAAVGYYQLAVDKNYWKLGGGIQLIGGGTWNCRTGCLNANGNVENTNFFDFIPGQIGARSWNHVEIYVMFQTDPQGGGMALSMQFDPFI